MKKLITTYLLSIAERVIRWMKRTIARYLPGLLLGAMLLGIHSLSQWVDGVNTGEEYRNINGFNYSESAMRKTGLGAMAHDAANTSLYYDRYFRDGDSLTLFHVQDKLRESVFERVASTKGWQCRQVTGAEYEQLARHFRSVAASVRPDSQVVFDAFFYEDLYVSVHGKVYDEEQTWEWLPEWLNMNNQPYTTDYRFAFYDIETGLFICYDQTS